jgi:SNF2 family DNA or RNA helicase
MNFDDLKPEALIEGLVPGQVTKLLSVEAVGPDAKNVWFRGADNQPKEQLVFRSQAYALRLAQQGSPWGFDAGAEEFRLAAEAYRIHLAHLFDPLMAVHTSNVDPLPHQITAVYETMLSKQPLRFVLADDPGAGKTIMAGLLIRELKARGDLERCLIVAPGSLVEQWQDELESKFNLNFDIFSREMVEGSVSSDPFREKNQLICRVDQLSRSEDLREKLKNSSWDLVIVDEAHKLSASYFGNELKKTKRYQLGELLGSLTRHLLLMTATPHNGKEEDFQAFLALIDTDRFHGKFRDGMHQINVSDVMRRMIKEELVKFDGTRLFPQRIAETVNYQLSRGESALYAAVTTYVVEEMNRAERLEDGRKGTVGFALTMLQRRLASSPEAILQSLKRRLGRLEKMLGEAKIMQRGLSVLSSFQDRQDPEVDIEDIVDEMEGEEAERAQEEIISESTAARTVEELQKEIEALKELVTLASEVRVSGEDRKWQQLSNLLMDNPQMRTASGHRRKLIIFTEHRDTLNYLRERLTTLLGDPAAIEVIHGSVKREDRKKAVEKFTNYSDCTILLATDAAGEGVNLQCAHLMINYDLPWNPNRIEQRFGRIHRIGQTEVCRLWNLVAKETREGAVFHRLFEKLEESRRALEGKVFDVLGRVFEDQPLKDMLIQAILHNDSPEVRAKLFEKIDAALDRENLERVMEREAIAADHLALNRVFKLKEEMEKAEAQRLQPYFIRAFFEAAFSKLGGNLKPREQQRFEITHVPPAIRDRDRQIGRGAPVLEKYSRVCFEKSQVRVLSQPMATLLAPGHPLMDSVVDLVLENSRSRLQQGTVLIDSQDFSKKPRLLFIIDHEVRDGVIDKTGTNRTISRRLHHVFIEPDGTTRTGGPAPYLDYAGLPAHHLDRSRQTLSQWSEQNLDQLALRHAVASLVPEHFNEVRERRQRAVQTTLEAVHARLTYQINYWSHRYEQLRLAVEAGNQPRMQPENARRTAEELSYRLEKRTRELEAQRGVVSQMPHVIGAALIIPQGLLLEWEGRAPSAEDNLSETDRAAVEAIGMNAVIRHERSLGFNPVDVSADNCGWDITSVDDRGNCRFIEVKARRADAATLTVTKNEMLVGYNKRNGGWYLAVVLVDGDNIEGPHYIQSPFDREPGWAETSVNFDIRQLLQGRQTA